LKRENDIPKHTTSFYSAGIETVFANCYGLFDSMLHNLENHF